MALFNADSYQEVKMTGHGKYSKYEWSREVSANAHLVIMDEVRDRLIAYIEQTGLNKEAAHENELRPLVLHHGRRG